MKISMKIDLHYQRLSCSAMTILFMSRDQRRCAEADRDPQNIWDPRKDCGPFVDEKLRACGRYIVGTLTNKANIIIYM